MAQYISKSDLVAEIESKKKYAQTLGNNAINNSMQQFYDGMKQGCVDILSLIDTLEVKEICVDLGDHKGDKSAKYIIDTNTLEVKDADLEKKLKEFLRQYYNYDYPKQYQDGTGSNTMPHIVETAKYFFNLGLKASNPITKENLESLVRQVIGLYLEAGKHYNSVIKEERKEYGGSDLVIKLLDGVIDAKELSIQYVLDKLKAQKGEEA